MTKIFKDEIEGMKQEIEDLKKLNENNIEEMKKSIKNDLEEIMKEIKKSNELTQENVEDIDGEVLDE